MNNTTIAKRNEAFSKNTRGSGETRLVRWTRSLLVRTVLGVIVAAVLTTGALFLSIDHLVTRQFEELHADRVERVARHIESAVATELALLAGLAELLVRDADLKNSAHYHLYLEGEVEHPRAAVERISEAFGLRSAGLWAVDGRLVAAGSGDLPAVAPVIGVPDRVQASGLYQVGEEV